MLDITTHLLDHPLKRSGLNSMMPVSQKGWGQLVYKLVMVALRLYLNTKTGQYMKDVRQITCLLICWYTSETATETKLWEKWQLMIFLSTFKKDLSKRTLSTQRLCKITSALRIKDLFIWPHLILSRIGLKVVYSKSLTTFIRLRNSNRTSINDSAFEWAKRKNWLI